MRKYNHFTITAVLLGLFINHNSAFSKEMDQKEIKQNYTEVSILDKGVKRTLYIERENHKTQKSRKTHLGTYSNKMQESKDGLLVSFKDPSKMYINEFEIKYGLKLKEKLMIGYYVFKNISDSSDIEIISTIISNEKNIKTVKPNWKKKNQPR